MSELILRIKSSEGYNRLTVNTNDTLKVLKEKISEILNLK